MRCIKIKAVLYLKLKKEKNCKKGKIYQSCDATVEMTLALLMNVFHFIMQICVSNLFLAHLAIKQSCGL